MKFLCVMNGKCPLYPNAFTRGSFEGGTVGDALCGAASKINATANQDDNVIHQLNPRA